MSRIYRNSFPKSTSEQEYVLELFAQHRQICKNDFVKGIRRSEGRQVSQVARLIHQLEKKKTHSFQHLHPGEPGRDEYCVRGCRFVHFELEPRQSTMAPEPKRPAGWRSQGFQIGNPANYSNVRKDPRPVSSFQNSLNYEMGLKR